jgi:GTP pyrophosphokinase
METTPATSDDPALASALAALQSCGVTAAQLASARAVAAVVLELTGEAPLAVAGMVVHTMSGGLRLEPPAVGRLFGEEVARLARSLLPLSELGLGDHWTPARKLDVQQAEALRKMLLAVASDPRLVVARMASQLLQLRDARAAGTPLRQRLAVETREIFAPLANRLGLWALKWELEDLAFRFLEPASYHQIAAALAEKRGTREQYISDLVAELRQALQQAGIEAEVYGRPKHIYSIWRKMQRKHLSFAQVFDVRALRVLVASVADCYAALGIIHGRWPFIASEFDDYVAIPKGNNYQSIHTAVTGPGGRAVEIQIRTREMHAHAELGVAAHWRYKEGGGRDARYEQKIEWARHLLDSARAADGEGDFLDQVRRDLFADRIYVFTPRGDVIDLPRGATPLDFAYHVHTELGHRCRGAKVDGSIVPLNTPLANGAVVEVITGRTGGPSRDWLNIEDGFLASSRSRAKVRAWFHAQDSATQPVAPVAGAAASAPEPLAPAGSSANTIAAEPPIPLRRSGARRGKRSGIDIEGVGDLPTTLARCCGPMPPMPIAGYMTLGRGVTIHRASCPAVLRMQKQKPERVLRVQWNLDQSATMPVRVTLEAYDRRGLLRDVSDVLAVEHLSIEGVNSNTDPRDRIATITLRTAVADVAQLNRLLKRLKSVPNVLRTARVD